MVSLAAPTTRADKEIEAEIDGSSYRRRRLQRFVDHMERHCLTDGRQIRVLDLGGSKAYWQTTRPVWERLDLDITIVNLGAPTLDDGCYHLRPGDACHMADHPANTFDIVHSNSVIEHVGHWREMTAMAAEVRRLAPHYFVQTPNMWFPLEPHFRTLGFHWLPKALRMELLMRRGFGFRARQDNVGAAIANVQSVNLLTARQMQHLFPDAVIERERVMGLTKSLIAIR